jgi:hypothetical protein
VAHVCNPSYSGGSRFQVNLGKQFPRPYLEKKKPITKKVLVEGLKVEALSSNPSTPRKKKEKENICSVCEHLLHCILWVLVCVFALVYTFHKGGKADTSAELNLAFHHFDSQFPLPRWFSWEIK